MLLHDIAYPKGSVKLMGLSTDEADSRLEDGVIALNRAFRDRDVFSSCTVLENPGPYVQGLVTGMQALRGAFFKPNIVFLELPETDERESDYAHIQEEAAREKIGVIVHAPHPKSGLGERRAINIWIRDRSPDWRVRMKLGNLDLPILLGYKLLRNWNASMRLITVVEREESVEEAHQFLEALLSMGRIPRTSVEVVTEPFASYLLRAPQADVSIFGLGLRPDFPFMRRMVSQTRSTCLFARDSGSESALA